MTHRSAFQAIYPSEKSVEGERNADSLVLLLEHEAFRGLLTGDIGQEQEKKFIEAYGNMKIDWYKAAHHGSKTSNSKEFLEVLQPKLATISCGRNNSYGHPGKEAVESYAGRRCRNLSDDGVRTD